jgi:hypothetical protein
MGQASDETLQRAAMRRLTAVDQFPPFDQFPAEGGFEPADRTGACPVQIEFTKPNTT